jgi:hypothetical protein
LFPGYTVYVLGGIKGKLEQFGKKTVIRVRKVFIYPLLKEVIPNPNALAAMYKRWR